MGSGTRPYEWGTQGDLNSLVRVCSSKLINHYTTQSAPKIVIYKYIDIQDIYTYLHRLITLLRHSKMGLPKLSEAEAFCAK